MKTNKHYFSESGKTLLETLLAITIVTAIAPFVYMQIRDVSIELSDLSLAKKIMAYKSPMMNFARLNYNNWTNNAQIILNTDDIKTIIYDSFAIYPYAAFIDKYSDDSKAHLDIYLAFRMENQMRSAKMAKNIGKEAGFVGENGTAYNTLGTWGVSAREFQTGDLIYRISGDFIGKDNDKYLHRTGDEKSDGNKMFRDLYFANNNIFDIAKISAKTLQSGNVSAVFTTSKIIDTNAAYFPNGANIEPNNTKFNFIKILGDITGFRNIFAKKLSGSVQNGNWANNGQIIADRANISGSVNVSKNLTVKSDTTKTISDFISVTTHSIYTSYANITKLYFASGFGITISSELLNSKTNYAIKIGSWTFPSTTPPKFSALSLVRANGAILNEKLPYDTNKFNKLLGSGWKEMETQ